MTKDAAKELRTRILDEAAKLFDSKGIKFTMDDLAHSLGMSKKTIYTVFKDKRSIMIETIDRFFDDALADEQEIVNNEYFTIPDKLMAIISLVPDRYTNNDLSQLHVLKEKYPAVYKHWKKCREKYWEAIETLLLQGIEEGSLRYVSIPIFKTMFRSTIEQFFQRDVLVKNGISYKEALADVAYILVNGITAK